jgi:hypothetical protein
VLRADPDLASSRDASTNDGFFRLLFALVEGEVAVSCKTGATPPFGWMHASGSWMMKKDDDEGDAVAVDRVVAYLELPSVALASRGTADIRPSRSSTNDDNEMRKRRVQSLAVLYLSRLIEQHAQLCSTGGFHFQTQTKQTERPSNFVKMPTCSRRT